MPTSTYGWDLHHGNSYGSGQKNSKGLHIPSTYDPEKQIVCFDFTIEKWQEGAPGYAHGGVIASILDEAQGNICLHLGTITLTKSLSIQYHLAMPVLSTITVKAWITKMNSDTIETEAHIYNTRQRKVVSSQAIWYILPDRIAMRRYTKQNPKDFKLHAIVLENRKRYKNVSH